MENDEALKRFGYAPGNYMSRCHSCNATIAGLDKRAISCRDCALKRLAEIESEAKVGDVVWFRGARMYGCPEVAPARAMVTRCHGRGVVDLEIGCDGMSTLSGEAGRVPWKGSLTGLQVRDGSCWWRDA